MALPVLAAPLVVGLVVGGVGGLWAGGAFEELSRALKWTVLGGVVYVAGKALKAW